MSPEVQQIVISLVSGLVGAVIGGFISSNGAVKASKVQIAYLHRQDKEKERREEKEREASALRAFYIETKENLESISRWKSTRDYFRFGIEAWDLYKSVVKSLKPEVVQKLIKAYSEMRRHNTSVDYHIELLANAHEREVGMARNRKQTSLEDGISGIEQALNALDRELVDILDVVPPIRS